MPYATVADLLAAFGEQEVIALADREDTGAVDDTVALEALERASSEADTYLAARYQLPLSSTPKALVAVVCDMARYRLTGGETTETTPIATRYRAAVAWLKDVAAGRAVLPSVAATPAGGGVEFCTGRRDFARVSPASGTEAEEA
ncbi:MAG: DUF1320 domain-containing protein [Deltaproteobacteria bacterium HGW-Deltaproteobacteria-8]|jgi:phage gp36-like protein|nr:MAG: DUF1320 domain-containing protein [Deltaproteobacteria bacterium HGW-Deltaproteobacteria-8]